MYRQTEMFPETGGGGHAPDAQPEAIAMDTEYVPEVAYISGGELVRVIWAAG